MMERSRQIRFVNFSFFGFRNGSALLRRNK